MQQQLHGSAEHRGGDDEAHTMRLQKAVAPGHRQAVDHRLLR